ncbi:Protein CBG15771 [Caenorhabditis briggsae]|uniref:Uncharacterized protein n=2 Tax=Caenorhabditis briggsae TaxID=6238 RepID=A0AAE9IMC6_CAEBR|nr:Protein CBG15771 [Caenorhabditis briggsae]ULT98827.1 hypothetical protein L3Y34_000286 [Caenorhabditis briggsae]CAP33943.1 Protein CBG15771 [Caenorhabditis briggsae]
MSTLSEQDNMETAIELPMPRREPTVIQRIYKEIEFWFLAFTSETALAFYVLLHWLLACVGPIVISDAEKKSGRKNEENGSFLSFIYFMTTLVAFLSLMSHVSGLLIPLFAFCTTGAVIMFALVNLATLDTPESQELFRNVCLKSNMTTVYFDMMEAHPTATVIKSWSIFVFFIITCAAILFQFVRNKEYLRRPQPLFAHHHHGPIGFYPGMMILREIPIGPTNPDEPPRYSTLEPISTPPKPRTTNAEATVTPCSSSTVTTSPPRYSYWERTFGRRAGQRTTTQSSDVSSNREFSTKTAKNQ